MDSSARNSHLALALIIFLLSGCGARTGVDDSDGARGGDSGLIPDAGSTDAGIACEQLQVVRGPQTLWPATEETQFHRPSLVTRGDGFDLAVRRSDAGHGQVLARRVRLLDGGTRIEVGDERRVITDVHDDHQLATSGGRLLVCSNADPGGPYNVRLESFVGEYSADGTALLGRGSCHGVASDGDGFQVAWAGVDDDSALFELDANGQPTGEERILLEGMEDIEVTTRLGSLADGFAWVKRTTERNRFFLGIEPTVGPSLITEFEVEQKALYLRVAEWPMPDGIAAVSYIHTEDERMAGPAILAVIDGSGNEVARHESDDVRFGFIEPNMAPSQNGLLRIFANVGEEEVSYRVELFTEGASPVGDPVVFMEPGASGSRASIAEHEGLILAVWDAQGEREIRGAVLRCGAAD